MFDVVLWISPKMKRTEGTIYSILLIVETSMGACYLMSLASYSLHPVMIYVFQSNTETKEGSDPALVLLSIAKSYLLASLRFIGHRRPLSVHAGSSCQQPKATRDVPEKNRRQPVIRRS